MMMMKYNMIIYKDKNVQLRGMVCEIQMKQILLQ